MIIEIKQTASNIKQSFDVLYNNNYKYSGRLGSFLPYQSISLNNQEETYLKGSFKFSNWVNYIPLRHLLGIPNQRKCFVVEKDGTKIGKFFCSANGFYKFNHVIKINGNLSIECYDRLIKSFNYVSFYINDKQIALLETYLSVTDYKYNHKLYLIDEYEEYKDILSLFILYYANFYQTRRFHMSKVSNSEFGFTLSFYNEKYDPEWREKYFPNENFWGPINLFD